MADLFGDVSDSDSETDTTGTFKPAQIPTSNGLGEASPPRNGVASPGSSVNEVTLSDELPPRYGGEAEDERGPRDDIRVTVTGYQKAAEDYTFDVEVMQVGGAG